MKKLARTPTQLGSILKQTRRDKKLSQTDLAGLTGLWQETISKIETGNPATRVETLFSLLAALDLEITISRRSKGSPQDIEDMF